MGLFKRLERLGERTHFWLWVLELLEKEFSLKSLLWPILTALAVSLIELARNADSVRVAISAIYAFGGVLLLVLVFQRLRTTRRPESTSSIGTPSLRKLSNEELRERVIPFAQSMRNFEAGYHAASQGRDAQMRLAPSATVEQRQAASMADRVAEDTRRGRFDAEFMSRFRPEAFALWQELEARLGIFPPYAPFTVPPALEHSLLAGASPVSMSADYLERLARRLPE